MRRLDARGGGDDEPAGSPVQPLSDRSDRSVGRRRFLAAVAAVGSGSLAGCGGRLPGTTASVDAQLQRDDGSLTWEYPAEAVRGDADGDGIGSATVAFDSFDRAWNSERVLPGLAFTLNSTVGTHHAGEQFQAFHADWFRFRIGVPRTYDGTAGFQAFVAPTHWPELRTTYGYEGGRRELVVTAPDVDTDGTIKIEGRFRSTAATLPRRLHCGFELNASQPGAIGRTVTVDESATLDISALDLPDGVKTN